MKVSVILPTYDEAGNIIPLIEAIFQAMPEGAVPEVIVVDDNSRDGTYQLVCDRFRGDSRVVPLLRTTDRGFAKSIRTGIERSTGEQVIVMDTDFTHAPEEIPRLLHVARIYDFVLGSRFCAGGAMQDVTHYLSSLFYNFILRVILRTQVQDNLGGYFTAPRKLLTTLPFDLIFFGYGDYFFRLLFFVEQARYSIVELPCQYRARTHGVSKSNFFKMLLNYSFAAIRLQLEYRKTSQPPPSINKKRGAL